MNDILKCGLAFIVGAVTAAIVTNKVVDKKYRQIADDEINSMKEYYKKKYEQVPDPEAKSNKEEKEPEEGPSIDELYQRYEDAVCKKYYKPILDDEENETVGKPYVIPPNELGDTDYEIVEMVYYGADAVLADDDDKEVTDFDDLIGPDSISRIGEYDVPSVCVRNDRLHKDFEILYDPGYYSQENADTGGD